MTQVYETRSRKLSPPKAKSHSHIHNVHSHRIMEVWKRCTAVCFDVDSTVCQDEAIDRLAEHCGVGPEVKAWTAKAMGGAIGYRESLTARLDIMKPSLANVEKCVSDPPQLTPGITELVAALHAKGVKVYLVTGGFHRIVVPVAEALGISTDNIFANRLQFDEAGVYTGFDEEAHTSRTNGKPKVVAELKTRPGHEVVAMVGDGATDMEARPPADVFVGFGGNAVREKVKAGADWFVMDFAELISSL